METKFSPEKGEGFMPTVLDFHMGSMTPDKYRDMGTKTCPVSVLKVHHDQHSPSTSHNSPNHVRFGACGLRSDNYLRHVLTSPYHKSGSPMSVQLDTGSPMVFKTPNRDRFSTPSSSHVKTPSSSHSHPGVSAHVTPQSRGISNPFDAMDDRIHFPGFSPGLFTVMSTPAGEDGKTFQWAIEHIAALNPANIDEMPHQLEHGLDREAEERAQRAISHFFANQLIAPSPWNAPERKYLSPCTPVSQSGVNRPTQMFPEDLQGSIQQELSKLRRSQDASCQTTLSLPVDFDVQNVLGEHMIADVPEETNQEALSTSSLRRKLFFQGDTSTTLSPVKSAVRLEELTSPPVSPLPQTTPEWEKQAYRTSTSSGQFSSSPIKGPSGHLPFFRRSSESEYLASPELSPINKKKSNRANVYRSSGCGVPNGDESFTFDTENIKQGISPLLMPDMSPISSEHSSRNGDVKQRLSPLPMPDMSPISCGSISRHGEPPQFSPLPMTDMSPIPQCGSTDEHRDLGASYLPEPSSEFMSNDSSTPQAEDRVTSPSVICSSSKTPIMAFREFTAMDIESSSLDCFQFKNDNRTYTFSAGRDLSVDEMDTTSDYPPQPSSCTQDTGYQTASLQLTNHDTGLHTNLTSHFNSLPFKTESSIDRNELEDSIAVSKVCLQVCLDFDQQSQQSDHDVRDMECGQSDSGMAEDDVLERARQALALANDRCPRQTCDLDSSQSALPIEPISSSTPTKRSVKRIERKIAVIKKPGNVKLASEMAKELLQKAGKDLAKYSSSTEKQVSVS